MTVEVQMEPPSWLMGNGKVDEIDFCQQLMHRHNLAYLDGAFFTTEGRITDDNQVKRWILDQLGVHVRSGIGGKTESIYSSLKLLCARSTLGGTLVDSMMELHVANGTFRLDEGFSEMKYVTRYRLPVRYIPTAPEPKRWLSFLEDLLYPEDIPTLQEYMGYCLIPNTMGQKMLIITGKGGEGKSRIGVVMHDLLGVNMNLGSIAKVEKSPFARADLQHILLMVDDDLKMEALDQTNYLKSIITAELPMDLERKGVQSYQGKLNVRFLAFGNGTLQALHDRSHGFFRRQILLETRERPRDRKDDPYLSVQLHREREGILLWAIEGLRRLIVNDYRFTMSRRARDNLLRSMAQSNNVLEFLKSDGYFRFEQEGHVTSRQLYECYKDWCSDNAYSPLASNSFWSYLMQNQEAYAIRYSKNIPIGNGKTARGFLGMRLASRF